MHVRVQILSIAITGGLFLFVFELVRRKRLSERYALMWLSICRDSNRNPLDRTSVYYLYGSLLQ